MQKIISGVRSDVASWAGILLSLLLSLTPLYGLGYLVFAIIVAHRLRIIRSFDSFFSNFILTLLILACSIMVAGIFTSYLDVPNYAIINIAFAFFFCGTILYFQPDNNTSHKSTIFNLSDGVAVLAGVLLPLIIVVVHLSALGINDGLFRIVNGDGWDSTSHVNFLQVTAENRNYLYSTSPLEVDGKKLSSNYPQGWHLASSNIINGVLPGALNPRNFGLATTLVAYLAAVFAWYFMACYVLVKMIWSLLKPTKHKKMRIMLVFIVVQLPILMLYLSLLSLGFVNYLGLIPLILVICLMSYETLVVSPTENIRSYLVLSSLLTTGVYLMWVLPTPALILLILLTSFTAGFSLKRFISLRGKFLLIGIVATLALAATLYAHLLLQQVGISQVQAGSEWDKITQMPTAIFTGLALAALFYFSHKNNKRVILILVPFLFIILGLWLYTYLKIDSLGYYNAKMLALVFVIMSAFGCTFIVRALESIDIGRQNNITHVTRILLGFGVVATILLVSNQTLDMRPLRHSNYFLSSAELVKASGWAYSHGPYSNGEQLFIGRSNVLAYTGRAMLFNHLDVDGAARFLTSSTDSKYTCLQYIHWDKRGHNLSKKNAAKKLSSCLKIRSDANLRTELFLPRKAKPVYDKIDTYNARIIYY